jgi:hypothetical protein
MLIELAESEARLRPWLRVVYPPELVSEIALGEAPVVIGRSPKRADLPLDDEWVSRLHCRLWLQDGEIRVEDLGSTNGTFIDGTRITGAILGRDASLQLGRIVIRLQWRPDLQLQPEPEPGPTDAAANAASLLQFHPPATLEDESPADSFLRNAAALRCSTAAVEVRLEGVPSSQSAEGDEARSFVFEEVVALLDAERLSDELLLPIAGDGFCFFVREITREQAALFATNVRKLLERQVFSFENAQVRLKVHLRIAHLTEVGSHSAASMLCELAPLPSETIPPSAPLSAPM